MIRYSHWKGVKDLNHYKEEGRSGRKKKKKKLVVDLGLGGQKTKRKSL